MELQNIGKKEEILRNHTHVDSSPIEGTYALNYKGDRDGIRLETK